MKKYLLKKRVLAILISLSMLISAIVMIPIPIEHVRAEDIYSAEEAAGFAGPIVLPVGDDGAENVIIDIADINAADIDTEDIDTADIDTVNTDTADDDTADDDTADDIAADFITDNTADKNDCDEGDEMCNGACCEACEELCDEMCNGACAENGCPCCSMVPEKCEICGEECVCEHLNPLRLLRAEKEILNVRNVDSFAFLANIITANVNTQQAPNFEGNLSAATINSKIKSTDTAVVVNISSDILFTAPITIPNPHNITLTSQKNTSNRTYMLYMDTNIRHFTIKTGGSLILNDIILRGNPDPNPSNNNTRGGIDVFGGSLTTNVGAQIINCSFGRSDGTGGGAVTILDSGLFTMEGGLIYGNRMTSGTAGGSRGGGGVYVGGNGNRFNMKGGNIEYNFATMPSNTAFSNTGGGGVYVAAYGRFAMSGGEIKKNETIPTLGSQNGGGGVFVGAPAGTMVFTGGIITENKAKDNGSNWQGGGGIFAAGIVYMGGGEIHNNTAAWEGGGVFVSQTGYFHMYEGKITENHADSDTGHGGGGVMIAGGSFITDNYSPGEKNLKIISGNHTENNSGGFSVLAKYGNDFSGLGVLEIVDGTVITGNRANPDPSDNIDRSTGGAITLNGGATLNLYGGEIHGNIAGNNKGITWVDGTINLRGNPRVGNSSDTESILRHGNNPQSQVMNIEAPLGDNTYINVREDIKDHGRPDSPEPFTVIARKKSNLEPATDRDAGLFHYLSNGIPRSLWSVMPRDADKDHDLILGRSSVFSFVHFPEDMHFGERPLWTTKLVGPYGDAPGASNVGADFLSGADNWRFGFEVANTTHNNWYVTLQATPFVNTSGIVGAIPMAVSNVADNQAPEDLTLGSLIIFKSDAKGESIKWHWTQMEYKIEAQTKLDTVVIGKFQSVFSWNLLNVL